MKLFILILFVAISSINKTFAQIENKATPKKHPVSSGKDDDCMLHDVYDKPLEINVHQKNKANIAHTTADYIQFNQNGIYTESIGGKLNTGTWTFDTVTKVLTVNCSGTKEWNLTSSKGQYSLSNPTESIQIKRK